MILRLVVVCGIIATPQSGVAQPLYDPAGARLILPRGQLVPPKQGKWPEPIEFAYSPTALEAAKWWQGISAKDGVDIEGLSAIQLKKSLEDVQKFAQEHEGDAPLLLAWQVGNENWRVHLTPSQAVSLRYPPSTKKWGVPKKHEDFAFIHGLVPENDAKAITPDMAESLIIWPSGNALFWQIMYLLSHSAPRWLAAQQEVDIYLDVREADIETGGTRSEMWTGSHDGFQEARLAGNVVLAPSHAMDPIPSVEAALQQKIHVNDEEPGPLIYTEYVMHSNTRYGFVRRSVQTTPARFSRILATLDERYLTDHFSQKTTNLQKKANVPLWMHEGLQNIYSLEVADITADASRFHEWYPTVSYEIKQYWDLPVNYPKLFLSKARAYPKRGGITATPIDESAVWSGSFSVRPMGIGSKTPTLDKLDSTRQMRFFFNQYGAGAVTETLQRLGSGQSTDEAFLATTGLTQAQFLVKWQASLK